MNTGGIYLKQTGSHFSFLLAGVLIGLGLLAAAMSFLPPIEISGMLAWLLLLDSAVQLVYASQLDGVGRLTTWLVLVAGVYFGASLQLQTASSPDLAGLVLLLTLLVIADVLINARNYLASHKLCGGNSFWMLCGSFITLIVALIVRRNWSFDSSWRLEMLVGVIMTMTGMTRLLLGLSVSQT
jgi:hypothetical protein